MVKYPLANIEDARDSNWTPGWGRAPGEGNGNLPQYSCLENPTDRRVWWTMVHGGHKNQIGPSTCACMCAHTHTHTHIFFFKYWSNLLKAYMHFPSRRFSFVLFLAIILFLISIWLAPVLYIIASSLRIFSVYVERNIQLYKKLDFNSIFFCYKNWSFLEFPLQTHNWWFI